VTTGDHPPLPDATVTVDASRWGDELYFRTPVDVPAGDARAEVPERAVAYWPQGNAVWLFWGPTPASHGDESEAGEVAVDGDVERTLERFASEDS
jgi:hypothetical protein